MMIESEEISTVVGPPVLTFTAKRGMIVGDQRRPQFEPPGCYYTRLTHM